ncbi:hypothetical protein CDAR_27791 [Caerostris darwini]|uniref:Uncharacterized protein n=1 Tax=Caerostris darwini TaxID=1538125 RepID=A0AAV4SP43_9ARAC|nr:hypothetical protein CDAR_27791 [Caerostris darwini]
MHTTSSFTDIDKEGVKIELSVYPQKKYDSSSMINDLKQVSRLLCGHLKCMAFPACIKGKKNPISCSRESSFKHPEVVNLKCGVFRHKITAQFFLLPLKLVERRYCLSGGPS